MIIHFACDKCGNDGSAEIEMDERPEEVLESEGWAPHPTDGGWVCPECYEEAQREEEERSDAPVTQETARSG